MGDEKEYKRIWKGIATCVKQCLVDEYSSLEEMLYRYNWYPVHVSCRGIIEMHMKPLKVNDPHMFDKAVCWHAVEDGLDRDPKWRGICSFFFAAAMELVMIKNENEKYRQIKSTGGGQSGGQADHAGMNVMDLIKRLISSHDELHDKHKDLTKSHADLHNTVNEIRTKVSNSNSMSAHQQVHINLPPQAAGVHPAWFHAMGGPSAGGWPFDGQSVGGRPSMSQPDAQTEGGLDGVDMEKLLELLMGHASRYATVKNSKVDPNRFNSFGTADEKGITGADSY